MDVITEAIGPVIAVGTGLVGDVSILILHVLGVANVLIEGVSAAQLAALTAGQLVADADNN